MQTLLLYEWLWSFFSLLCVCMCALCSFCFQLHMQIGVCHSPEKLVLRLKINWTNSMDYLPWSGVDTSCVLFKHVLSFTLALVFVADTVRLLIHQPSPFTNATWCQKWDEVIQWRHPKPERKLIVWKTRWAKKQVQLHQCRWMAEMVEKFWTLQKSVRTRQAVRRISSECLHVCGGRRRWGHREHTPSDRCTEKA